MLSVGEERDEWQTGSATLRELIHYNLLEVNQFIGGINLRRIHSAEPLSAGEGYSTCRIVHTIKLIRNFELRTNVWIHSNVSYYSALNGQCWILTILYFFDRKVIRGPLSSGKSLHTDWVRVIRSLGYSEIVLLHDIIDTRHEVWQVAR